MSDDEQSPVQEPLHDQKGDDDDDGGGGGDDVFPSATGWSEINTGNRHVDIQKLQRVQRSGGLKSNSLVASERRID